MAHGSPEGVVVAIAVHLVMMKAGMSPGKQTIKYAERTDKLRLSHRARESSQSGRRDRLRRKKLKFQVESSNELREGPTYRSNIAMEEPEEITEIPPHVEAPQTCPVDNSRVESNSFYDLETDGLGFQPNIIQIAACCGDAEFNRYILPPTNRLSSKITDITGLSVQGTSMFHKGVKVDTVSLKDALSEFISFLSPNSNLVGHNIKAFDNRILLLHMMDHDLLTELSKKVASFMDTLPLAKELFPDRKVTTPVGTYKQETLVSDLLHISYDAHNALGDVTALQKLVAHFKLTSDVSTKHSISFNSTVQNLKHQLHTRTRKATLQPCINSKALSDQMATKVASSGLTLEHLKLAFKRGGLSGVKSLFTEKTPSGIRVTKSNRIISNVANFVETL